MDLFAVIFTPDSLKSLS
ncbi:hypothetical protein D039_2935A, partial [Vibrio parahaemolyticus EKP-028]